MLRQHESEACTLQRIAHLYLEMGWSPIPIWGDFQPERPKAAAIPWSDFQFRKPRKDEIDAWFSSARFGGIALVCGRVSGLAVLDFDREDFAEAFARACPDLAQTLTIRSGGRGLPHYYFRVPPAVSVQSRHIQGADFQAQAAYVVAPPTRIDGKAWEIVQDFDVLTLSQNAVARIYRFLEACQYSTTRAALKPETSQRVLTSLTPQPEHIQRLASRDEVDQSIRRIGDYALYRWYQNLALQLGRNNALFKIAVYLRDAGWSLAQALDKLVALHASQPPLDPAVIERVDQREREGAATVRSAFSRPPARRRAQPARVFLPNSIREKLLQLGFASVARVLDGLLLSGVRAGMLVSEKIICEILHKWKVGRRSIQEALRARLDGNAFFVSNSHNQPPLDPPEGQNASAAPLPVVITNQCLFVTRAKRVTNRFGARRGSPTRWYLMPDTAHLYRILSVSPTPGDALQLADLASPKAYRQALQRALINRRPALYSRGWLCTRLGISVWTCRRYDRQIGFQVRPAFFESWLDEKKALELPEESDEKNGVFLERSDGKRFPALRGIALDLIRRRWGVRLKRQHWNYYRYGPGRPILAPAHERPQPKIMVEPPVTPHPPAEKEQVFHPADESPAPAEQSRGHIWVCQECLKIRMTDTPAPPEPCPVCKQARWDSVPHSIWFDQQAVMAWWQALCRARNERMKPQPAPAAPPPSLTPRQAALAERLYSTIYDLKPERALARGMCYDLVIQYDEKLVTWILGELKERRNIYNPAGFVITVLRSEHKYGNFTLKR